MRNPDEEVPPYLRAPGPPLVAAPSAPSPPRPNGVPPVAVTPPSTVRAAASGCLMPVPVPAQRQGRRASRRIKLVVRLQVDPLDSLGTNVTCTVGAPTTLSRFLTVLQDHQAHCNPGRRAADVAVVEIRRTSFLTYN